MTNNRSELRSHARALFLSALKELRTERQTLPGTDLTPRMIELLRHLGTSGPLTFTELRQHTNVARATITELVDRLEERDLVLRFPDQRDGRRVMVGLTREGNRRLREVAHVDSPDPLTLTLTAMSDDDLDHLTRGLTALITTRRELP